MKKFKIFGKITEHYEIEIEAESIQAAHIKAKETGLEEWEMLSGVGFDIDEDATEEIGQAIPASALVFNSQGQHGTGGRWDQ